MEAYAVVVLGVWAGGLGFDVWAVGGKAGRVYDALPSHAMPCHAMLMCR